MRLAAFHHSEDLEENAPRYEPVVIDEKAEDEADPSTMTLSRVDDGRRRATPTSPRGKRRKLSSGIVFRSQFSFGCCAGTAKSVDLNC
jgi:hypothetical protein